GIAENEGKLGRMEGAELGDAEIEGVREVVAEGRDAGGGEGARDASCAADERGVAHRFGGGGLVRTSERGDRVLGDDRAAVAGREAVLERLVARRVHGGTHVE